MTGINDKPVVFTRADQIQLKRGLLGIRRRGIDTREDLVATFDKAGGYIGVRDVGPKRSALIKRALMLGPGRWNKLMELIRMPPDWFPVSKAQLTPEPGPEARIVMLFVYADYPGGGAHDLIRSFRASLGLPGAMEQAKRYFQQWISGADMDPRGVGAHIAALETGTGGMRILSRWDDPHPDWVYTPEQGSRMTWIDVPGPLPFGMFLDLPQDGGTHAGFTELPEGPDVQTDVQTVDNSGDQGAGNA